MPNDLTLRALEAARTFIRNGVALGYIRMPDADVPDPAHQTPKLIDSAIAALRAQPATPTPMHASCAACGQDYGHHNGTRCPTGVESHFKPAAATVQGDEREALRAAYVTHFGSDAGWCGESGGWFIEGYRAALAAPAAPQEPTDYKAMFQQAVSALGSISQALGIPDDEAATGEPEIIIDYIRELKRERDEWADAGYAAQALPTPAEVQNAAFEDAAALCESRARMQGTGAWTILMAAAVGIRALKSSPRAPRPSWMDGGEEAVAMAREDGLLGDVQHADAAAPQEQPSDEDIFSLAFDCCALPEAVTDETLLSFARALLSRYGAAPQGREDAEPVCYISAGELQRLREEVPKTGAAIVAGVRRDSYTKPLYDRPQPTTSNAPIDFDALVGRFLSWPLPASVCSDTCVSMSSYAFPRSGTNLLTADEARQMLEHVLAGITTPQPAAQAALAVPDDLRAQGWAVAVHNDYRLNGEPHTFWLLTKDGRAVKGEGRTDTDALDQIRAALTTQGADHEREMADTFLTPGEVSELTGKERKRAHWNFSGETGNAPQRFARALLSRYGAAPQSKKENL